MHRLRQPDAFTSIAASVAILAWFFASNHCAFGLMQPAKAAQAEHAHCPGHHAPDKDKSGGETSCCQSLQAPDIAQAKNLVKYNASVVALHVFFIATLIAPDSFAPHLNPLEIDTGPPHAASFAESVLQRSLLAHAPPFSLA